MAFKTRCAGIRSGCRQKQELEETILKQFEVQANELEDPRDEKLSSSVREIYSLLVETSLNLKGIELIIVKPKQLNKGLLGTTLTSSRAELQNKPSCKESVRERLTLRDFNEVKASAFISSCLQVFKIAKYSTFELKDLSPLALDLDHHVNSMRVRVWFYTHIHRARPFRDTKHEDIRAHNTVGVNPPSRAASSDTEHGIEALDIDHVRTARLGQEGKPRWEGAV
ncbi:hypothetical protein C8R45DRAFT_921094 [Mycena sanguinolenta]|nr:hypothetical protein C8R45DRAFT_921094 [Mycena sanguinolenta]